MFILFQAIKCIGFKILLLLLLYFEFDLIISWFFIFFEIFCLSNVFVVFI